MSDIKPGTKPDTLDVRDAIHVALVSVVAELDLRPGQRVGYDGGVANPYSSDIIGIVDPYLPGIVKAGTPFWLFLMPNTVTGMRHQWSHPSFPNMEPIKGPTKEESEGWLRDFASIADCPNFDVLITAAVGDETEGDDDYDYSGYENDGEYLFFRGRDAHGDIPDEFWDHVENFTGRKCRKRAKYFSCSC